MVGEDLVLVGDRPGGVFIMMNAPMGSVPKGVACFSLDLRCFDEIAANENWVRKSFERGFAGGEVCSRRVWDGEARA